MTTISSYPSGINELVLRGVPTVIPNPGKSFWVSNADVLLDDGNSVAGVDQAGGGTYQRPFRTVDFAIGQCTASRGDVIYVMPGHNETIGAAAAIDIDVAGVTIIGLGHGSLQPRFDFTATASTVVVDAANVAIYNINFHANVSAVTLGLSVAATGDDLIVKGCRFDVELTGTDEFGLCISLGGNDALLEDNIIDMGLGGATAAIRLVAIADTCVIRNNRISGDYSGACIDSTTTATTDLTIEYNLLIQGYTGGLNAVKVLNILTGSGGIVRHNDIVCDVATFALQTIGDTLSYINNNRTDDIDAAKTSSVISASVTVSSDA